MTPHSCRAACGRRCRRRGAVAGAVRHVLHGVDEGDDVVLLDVEVLDGAVEEFFFCRHGFYRIPAFCTVLERVLCEFC